MLHERVGALDGGVAHHGDEPLRTARGDDGVVQLLDEKAAHLLGRRVHVEDDGVARRDHADGIADDGLGGIRRRRDGADDAVGRAFDEHQTVVARLRDGAQDLGARRLVGDEQVLVHLVVDAAEAGLFDGHRSQLLHDIVHTLAQGRDATVPPFESHLVNQVFVGGAGRFHGGVDVVVDATTAR